MKTIDGYDVKVFTDNIEDNAMEQLMRLLSIDVFSDKKIRIMPDVHAGVGCVIGFTGDLGDKVIPDIVGVDIGCGMRVLKLGNISEIDFHAFHCHILANVPSGTWIRNEEYGFRPLAGECMEIYREAKSLVCRLHCYRELRDSNRINKAIGSLGGGNHFIEYGEDDKTQEGWLTIHCGSRNVGVKVANHWHNIAQNPKRAQFIGYLWGDALNGYLSDMIVAQAYALYNHHIIRDRIFAILKKLCKAKCVESLFTTHNYISVCEDYPMLRKGAVEAAEGERFCLPFNMRDGIAICVGKGNADWNCSAPHGAGRAMSRNAAKKNIEMDDFEMSMSGIFSTSVCPGTLDESPQAYKSMEEILRLIEPTAEVITMVKPRINIKDIPQ